MNKVILLGNVGKDPEIRTMQSGDRVANFTLATNERWKDRDGNQQERVEWHNIACWNQNLVSVIERFVVKGKQLYIEGKLQTRKWQDQNGNDRYSTDVVMPKYGGDLVLLSGGRNDGDARRDGRGGDDRYNDGAGGSTRPSRDNGGYGNRATGMTRDEALGGRSRPDPTLDDDIPF
jgi:single-strand DNA-binding protein